MHFSANIIDYELHISASLPQLHLFLSCPTTAGLCHHPNGALTGHCTTYLPPQPPRLTKEALCPAAMFCRVCFYLFSALLVPSIEFTNKNIK
jgi:hypothetical protein